MVKRIFHTLRNLSFKREDPILTPSLPYISARNMLWGGGGEYGYYDFIMVLHIISYKLITTVRIYNFFPACLRHLVQCLKCFLVMACQKIFFNSLKS